MSEKKSVEGISSSESATRMRLPEPAIVTNRTLEAREKDPPAPAPPPIEPSPAFRPYRVLLDPETRRLFTEVIDTRTGNVLLRIPPGYASPEEKAADAGITPRQEIEL